MRSSARTSRLVVSAALALLLPATAALAQDRDNKQDLDDFVHYAKVARPDLAEAHLRRLLDSGLSDAELAELIDATVTRERFEEALARGRLVEELSDIVAELETRYRAGDMARARNKERIAAAIADLVGTLRQQRMAETLLVEAGEYAVPQLLKEVTDGSDPRLRQKCVVIIEQIGALAVSPLSVALLQLDPQNQERVASMLSRMGSDLAIPYLAEVAANEALPATTREAAERALGRLPGGANASTVADAYANLARGYFRYGIAMSAYPTEASNNVWSYDAFVGLIPTPVPTEIHSDVMAMVTARKALQFNSNHRAALATFIGANLKRENDLAQGNSDPVFGDSAYSPEFYAMAAGPAVASDVLGLALDMRDTVLIRDAIDAFEKTAGDANLFTGASRQPILEALQYPDRRVRYDAALALGGALPRRGFQGDYSVVPNLASAVRAGDATFAVVIADDTEDQNTYQSALDTLGYTVIAQGASADEIEGQIAQAAGVDLIVVRSSADGARAAVNRLRSSTKTSVAPVVVMTTAIDETQLRQDYAEDPTVTVKIARDISAFGNIVDEAMAQVGGRMSEADAMAYSIEAIETLFDIAISDAAVYNIGDAEPALSDALATREGSIRHRIAGVLAHIDSRSAQQAILDAAFNSQDRDQIEFLRQAASSAKMWGNLAEERHIAALLTLVKAGGESGEAAARVHGAMNLPPENVVEIIAD